MGLFLTTNSTTLSFSKKKFFLSRISSKENVNVSDPEEWIHIRSVITSAIAEAYIENGYLSVYNK